MTIGLLTLKVFMAPALVTATTLCAQRYGAVVGGWLSALPVIAGPVLLVYDVERGAHYAQRAAIGILVGLVALSAFIAVYAHVARRRGVAASLVSGWLAFAGVAAATASWAPSAPAASLVALAAMGAAWTTTRDLRNRCPQTSASGSMLAVRATLTTVLVVSLGASSGVVGARLGGMLAAFPALASLLAGFVHVSDGGTAAGGLLHGMIAGLIGFGAFCLVVALTLETLGATGAFALATSAALVLQAATLPFVGQARRSPSAAPAS